MLKPFKIPASLLFATVTLLAVGELAAGTKPFFVAAMAATLLCIGVTYNILGGASTISGIAFAGFASCTIVISQFAKVIFFEAADKTLESPELTIKVYFVFYLCAMIGAFVYGRLRVRVPTPLEPKTVAQANIQYGISLSVGLVASLVFEMYETSSNPAARASQAHSLGLAFSSLLLFSIVLAVQSRIVSTNGRHSFGLKVFVPWAATAFFGFVETSRAHLLISTLVYAFTCYMSGYKFRRRHYLTAVLGVAFFVFILSPFEIYSRGPMRQLEFRDRLYEGVHLALTLPDWATVNESSRAGVESGSREEYYERPGTFVLSRLSAIRADSNMINACAGGFHYGFTALRIDMLRSLPRFLYKDKPDTDGAAYTGRVTGVNSDEVENGDFLITVISDSFGAFGWLGVIVVSLLGLPTTFILYESMFDITKPWGIVVAGGFFMQFTQVSMSGLIALTLRVPISILALSYFIGAIVRMIPVKGDEWFTLDQAPAE
jgi:cytochrome b561